jgi:hypothetical protein
MFLGQEGGLDYRHPRTGACTGYAEKSSMILDTMNKPIPEAVYKHSPLQPGRATKDEVVMAQKRI